MGARSLWWATLNSSSPRHGKWSHILGSDEVPLKSPRVQVAALNGNATEVYELDLAKLTAEQNERLVQWIASQFSVPAEEVRRDLPSEGFPIRAEDVSIALDPRAFI